MVTVTDAQARRGFSIIEITVPFCNITMSEPENPLSYQSGLQVEYYRLLSGSTTGSAISFTSDGYKADIVSQINYIHTTGAFASSGLADWVGAVFEGYLQAPIDGVYTFYLSSDDASELYIGEEKIIQNLGEHVLHMRERAGQVSLKAGMHKIVIKYEEFDKMNGLRLYWEGPGFDRQIVNPTALYH